ncbi:MAG: hypothetical protein Q4F83_11115 [Eubacteriales bacterium]|nr:hypothetical protein [Eubacteriales bacterium]
MPEKQKATIEKDREDEKRCFVMMPISDQGDYPQGHFTKVYEHIFKPAIEEAGFEPYRVDENKICDSIINKIFDAIQNCPMALCDLSNRNPNVLYELGLRQAYDKPVVLVQDEKTERIFDVSGINTVRYSSSRLYENVIEARKRIAEAIISTRDGKEYSMVKIMKAGVANVSSVSISRDDKLEIMLNGIMRDIQDLKDSDSKKSTIQNELERRYAYTEPISRYVGADHICRFKIPLKNGITNKQITETIRALKDAMFPSAVINYRREDGHLLVNAIMKDDGIPIKARISAEEYLRSRLS